MKEQLHSFLQCLVDSLLPLWQEKQLAILRESRNVVQSDRVQYTYSGEPGRPRILIESEQIVYLRDLGFSWNKIADIFGVSRMTLFRRRREYGFSNESQHTDISHLQLCRLVESIKEDMPDIGERMLNGTLRSKGVVVLRQKL